MNLLMYFWYIYMPVIGVLAMIIAPVLFVWWYKRKLPLASRILYAAKRLGLIPLLIFHDSGRAALKLILERRGEGVVVTQDAKYKILPRFVGGTEEATTSSNPEEDTDEEEENTDDTSKTLKDKLKGKTKLYRDWISKRCILLGLGLPFYIGYSGSLCAMNPEALALIEAGEMYVETEDGKFMTEAAKNKELKGLLQPLLLLDGREAKQYLNSSYDETQITAVCTDSELVGYLGRPLAWKKYLPIFLILGIAVLALIGIWVAPQLLKSIAPM